MADQQQHRATALNQIPNTTASTPNPSAPIDLTGEETPTIAGDTAANPIILSTYDSDDDVVVIVASRNRRRSKFVIDLTGKDHDEDARLGDCAAGEGDDDEEDPASDAVGEDGEEWFGEDDKCLRGDVEQNVEEVAKYSAEDGEVEDGEVEDGEVEDISE